MMISRIRTAVACLGVCLMAGAITGCQTTEKQAQVERAPTTRPSRPSTTQPVVQYGDTARQPQPAVRATAGSAQASATPTSASVSTPSVSAPTPTAPTPPAAAPRPAAPAVATSLPAYSSQTALRGRLRSIGSDTMDELMQLWEGEFKTYHGGLRFFHEGKGSGTATPALIEGQSDFGPMSRAMKDKEIDAFRAKFGYEPIQIRTAIDALAVYVHPSNPLAQQGLNFQQLDAIFSSTRKLGAPAAITTWGQLGLTGEWANAPIHIYGRNSASGTYGYFKSTALAKGEYRDDIRELAGSSLLVDAVAGDRFGIGYSGIGYKTDGVATVPLAKAPGEPMFPAEGRFTYTGQYPLARFLYMTINRDPSQATPALQREFLSYVLSSQGQAQVSAAGFFPLSPALAATERAKLD